MFYFMIYLNMFLVILLIFCLGVLQKVYLAIELIRFVGIFLS